MFVYQHSPRCPIVLQRFLDNNPDYWCLVPMEWLEAKADDATVSASSFASITVDSTTGHESREKSTVSTKRLRFADVLEGNMRSQEESTLLSKAMPKPPTGYQFSSRQIQEQIDFFKQKKESYVTPSHLVDLYNYAIVAVCKSHI